VLRSGISANTSERRSFRANNKRPITPWSLIAMGFLIAFVLAAIVLVVFGAGDRGTSLALQATARWSFLLFWSAYVGSAIAKLLGAHFDGWARHSRELGLAFASSQLVHVALVLWIMHIATEPGGSMLFFWVGIFCTYLLALFSIPSVRDGLGLPLWRTFRTVAMEYIALVFAADFIIDPLQTHKASAKYLLTYLPFALMLVGGVGVRVAAFARRRPVPNKINS
jgi:hypothetical protein